MSGFADALKALGFKGQLVTGVRLDAATVDLTVRWNVWEMERRRRGGLPALTNLETLELLESLPYGYPVPPDGFQHFERVEMDALGGQVVETTPAGYVRRWQPILDVTGIFLRSQEWRASLYAVSVFAGDAPRAVIVERRPRNWRELVTAARKVGVGIACMTNGGAAVLVPPERHLARADALYWQLCEQVYEQITSAARPTA